MSQKLNEIIEQCETELRAGRAQKAARLIVSLNSAEIAREFLLPVANLARRAGCTSLGLRLLAPLIYHDRGKWRGEATPQELAEYAVLLQNCGAVAEALQILKRVDTLKVPQAFLYRAFCHFNRWEYAEAIPHLEEYLKADISPYALLVGRVNLAAARFSADQHALARELIEANIESARQGGHSRLHGNSLEMRSQMKIFEQDYEGAERDLTEAAALLDAQPTADRLYVKKWTAVVQALKLGSRQALLAFRDESLRLKQWENVREADLFLLKTGFDQAIFDRLIFGSPYTSYRWRICRFLGKMPQRAEYVHGDAGGRIFDLMSGELDGRPALNAGKKIHQLIEVLTRDLYAPMKIGSLFTELFPGDHFDINSSPDRVHQVLRRARRWISAKRLPLRLTSDNGYYSLSVGTGLALKIPLSRAELSTHSLDFEKLKQLLPEREFSARDARSKLDLSPTSFNSLINWSLEKNLVVRLGRGPAVKYRLVG